MNPKFLLIGEGLTTNSRYMQSLSKHLLAARIYETDCIIHDTVEQIPTVISKVIILFGKESLMAFTTQDDLEARRGSIYNIDGVPYISTFHPKEIFMGGGTSHWYSPACINDLQRARAVAEGLLQPLSPKLRVMTRPEDLEAYMNSIAQSTGLCAFDIETARFGGDWIKCIGFACNELEGVVVPFDAAVEGQLDILKIIRKWMTSGQIGWIGQNGYNFDIPYICRVWGFEVKNYVADTMVMHHILYPEFPHDLATISSFYTTIPYWKDTSEENLHQYNCNDAVATWLCQQAMAKEIKERGFDELHRSYYHPLLTPLRIMSERGMRLDKDYQKILKGELREEIKGLQTELDKTYGQHTSTLHLERIVKRGESLLGSGRKSILRIPLKRTKSGKCSRRKLVSYIKKLKEEIKKKGSLNVRSNKDLAHFLYKVLKLPVKTKKGHVTTDRTALNQLYIKTKHPFLKTMIELRHVRNMLSRWGNLKTDENGLIGTTYSFAETGRLKSGKFEAK